MSGWGIGQVDFDSDDDSVDAVETPLDDLDFDWTPRDGDLAEQGAPEPEDDDARQPVSDVVAGANLVRHSSFESDRQWSVGPGWQVPFPWESAYHGSRVARIETYGPPSELVSNLIPVDVSRPMWASAWGWVLTVGVGFGRVLLREFDASGAVLAETVVGDYETQTTGWVKVSRQFVARRQDASKQTEWDVRTTGCRLVLIAAGVIDWRVDAVQVAVGDSESVYAPAPNEDLLGENIDPGTLPKEALEPGLAVIEVVDTLPTPDAFRVAMLTSDGRLYSAVDDAWRDVVSASELTGLLTSDQIADDAVLSQHIADGSVVAPAIADGALELAKFHNGLRPVQVVGALPGLPNTDYPLGAVVLLTTDQKLYRSTGSAWTSAVPAGDMTGQLSAGQLGITDFQNLAWNPGFESDHASWFAGNATIETTTKRTGLKSSKWVYAGGSVYQNNIWANPYSATWGAGEAAIPCVEGQKFYGEVWGRISNASANGGIYARFEFYNASGSPVSQSNGTYMNSLDNTQWKKASQVVAAPAGAAFVRFRPMADANQGPAVTFYLDDALFFRQGTRDLLEDGALELAKFANGLRPIQVLAALPTLPNASYPIGAVVLLTTDQKLYRVAAGDVWERRIDGNLDITAGTITGDRIDAGTITSGLIAAGAITTEKLTVGSVGDNAVVNGGFEDLQEDDQTKPANWSAATGGNWVGSPSWASVSTGQASGSRALAITLNASGDIAYVTNITKQIPVVGDEKWYVSCVVKGSGSGGGTAGGLGVWFYDAAGAYISPANFATTGLTTTYQKVEGSVTAPSNAAWMRVGPRALHSGLSGGSLPYTLTYDNVVAKRVTVTAMIADDAIVASKIKAGEIETVHMDTGTINASVLSAGSILAGHIGAGQVTTEKLTVGSVGDNAILNGGFEDLKASDATKPARMEMGGLTSWATETTEVLTGARSVKTTVSGSGVSGWMSVEAGAGYIPVVGGEQWYGSVYAKAGQASAGGMFFRAWFYDKGAVALSAPDDYEDFITGNRPFAVTWTKYEGIVTVPAGAAFMRVGFYHHGPGLGAVTYPHAVYWDDLTARKVIVSASIADGAIVANKIAAGAVLADKVAAGAITTEKLTVGGMSDNAVRNGSFEDLQYADATKPASWQEANNATAGGDWGLTTTAPAAGTRCLTLLVPTASDVAAVETTAPSLIPVVPGEQWYVSGQFKGSTAATGTGRKLYVHWFNAALGYVSSSSAEGTWETTWTRSEGVFTVPVGIAYMRVAVWASGLTMTGSPTYPFTGYVDDVVARKVVTSAVIADGAVIAQKVAAGSITTEKLTVGSMGDNVLLNGSFEDAQQADSTKPALFEASDPVGSYTWALETALANVRTGSRSLKTVVTGTGDRVAPRNPLSHAIPVVPGERWYIGVWHKASTAHTAGLYLRAWFWKADGSISATPSQDVVANGPLVASWTLREGTVTVPSDAAKMLVGFYHYGTGMAGATFPHTVYWDDLVARKMVVSAVIADGAITAQKMVIADFTSLVENPHFGEGDTGWIHIGDATAGTSIVNDPANAYRGNWVGKWVNRSTQQLGNNLMFPVQVGEKFFVTGTMKCAPGTTAGNAYVRLRYAGADKVALVAAHTTAAWTAADTTYSTKTFESTAPAGAVYARLDFQFPTISAGAWYAGEATCRRMNEGELIVDGAISASKVAAKAITAGKLVVTDFQNLVQDGSFENGTEWVLGAATSGPGWTRATGNARSGTYHAQYNGTHAGAPWSYWGGGHEWKATVDQGYVEVWYKTTADFVGTVRLGVWRYSGRDQSGSIGGAVLTAVSGTQSGNEVTGAASTSWTKLAADIAAPASGTFLMPYFSVGGTNGTGTAYVDDLFFAKKNTGSLIVDGAITAAKVAAGAIDVTKLTVTDLTNLAENADFEYGDVSWAKGSTWAITNSGARTGSWCASKTGGVSAALRNSFIVPVEVGDDFRAEAWLKTGTGGGAYVRICRLNASKVEITTVAGNTVAAGTSTWTLSAVNYTIPSGTSFIRVEVVSDNTGGTAYADDVRLLRRANGTLIVDGSITTAKIAAGQVTADRLLISGGHGAALNADPMTSDATAWTTHDGANWEIATVTDGKVGNSVLRSTGAAGNAWMYETRKADIDPTKVYRLHAWVRRKPGGNRLVFLVARFTDGSGAVVTNPSTGWGSAGQMNYWGLWAADTTALPADSVWREYTLTFGPGAASLPTNAKAVQVGAILNYTGGTTDGIVEVQDLRVEEVLPSALIQDGAITASKVAAQSITTEKLSVGALGDSVAPNSGFEELSSTDATKPAVWAVADTSASGTKTWAVETTNVLTGARSLKTTLSQSADCYIAITHSAIGQQIPVGENEQWYLSIWAKASSASTGGVKLRAWFYNSAGTYVTNLDAVANGNFTTGWVKYEGVVTVPSGQSIRFMSVGVYHYGPTMTGATYTHTAYWDDVVARKVIGGTVIANGAIQTQHINVGALDASVITVGTLTVEKLTFGHVTDNTILNGGFEELKSIAGQTTIPSRWDLTLTGTGSAGASEATGSNVRSGSKSFATTIPDAGVALVTSSAADDVWDTATPHGWSAGQIVYFTSLTGGGGFSLNTGYYVLADGLGSTTFKLSATLNGAVKDMTTDATAGTVRPHRQVQMTTSDFYPTVDGDIWNVSAWAKASTDTTGGIYVRVYQYDAAGNWCGIVVVYAGAGATTNWRLYSGQVVIKTQTAYPVQKVKFEFLHYGMGVNGTFPHTVYWDDYSARRVVPTVGQAVNDTSNMVADPGFEQNAGDWTWNNNNAEIQSTIRRTGTKAARFRGGNVGVFQTAGAACRPGDLIYGEGWVTHEASNPAGARAVLIWYNSSGTYLSLTSGTAVTASGTAATPITLATSAAADDIIDTSGAHGLSANDVVYFPSLTGGAGLTAYTPYYVIAANLAATTFQVSTTQGGAAVNFTTDITAGTVVKVPNWQRVTVAGTVPENAENVRLGFYTNGSSGTYWWYADDAYMFRQMVASDVIKAATLPASKFDTLAPNPPTGLTVTSAVTLAPDGTSVVAVRAAWTLPTLNSDSTALTDLDGTVVEATQAFTGTAELPTPDWTYPLVLNVAKEQAYVTFDGAGGNRKWWVRARCVDVQGNRSTVTSVVEHTTVGDTSAPDAPTALVVVPGFRGAALRWNPVSASDLSHYEVQYGITTTAPGGIPDVPTDGTITLATSAASDDIIDTATAHGLNEGDVVYFPTLTGGLGMSSFNLLTSAASDDIIDTSGSHGFSVGDVVVFPTLTGGAGLTAGTLYYVVDASLASNTFRVAATPGGTPVGFTTDITAGTVRRIRPYYVVATSLGAQTFRVAATPGGTPVGFTTDITAGTVRLPFSVWTDALRTKASTVWVPGLDPHGGPPANTSFYWFRVRSVDLSGNASPWTLTDEETRGDVAVQPTLTGAADIAANSITASHIHASGITADVLTSGLLQVSTGVADRIDGIGVTQTGGGGTKEVGHWDENGLVVRDYTTQSDYLKLTSGKVELYTGGNLVTAITPTGIDAGAIRFGQLPGGHNVVPNSSFEVAAYTSQTTLPNSGYTTVQQPNATISTGVITMTAVN